MRALLTRRIRSIFDNISVTNNNYNMRKFSNTIEVVSITVQVGLTTMFIAGALRVIYAIITGGIVDVSFGLMG